MYQVIDIVGPLFLGTKGSYESTTVSQSVSQSGSQNHFFSKTADRIFMKFHINFQFLKDKNVIQSRKNLILGGKARNIFKSRLFGVSEKIVPLMCYFWVYMMHRSCLYDSAKAACFGKISFSSYKRKCSRSIRLQDFLNFNITKTIWGIKFLY